MPRLSTLTKAVRHKNKQLEALSALSNVSEAITPELLSGLIHHANDPEAAVQEILQRIPECTPALENKWRNLINELWSSHHPSVPFLADIELPAKYIADAKILQDALAYLRVINNHSARMAFENNEWLVNAVDAHHLATQLPSRGHKLPVQLENEWQYLNMRRLRSVLEALRLVRRFNGELVIVKSRYHKFRQLPSTAQYYLLWHAETYHIDWGEFSGMWSEFINIIQEYLPILWSMSEGVLAEMPQDLRRWNQEVWDSYHPLWDQEGLLEKEKGRGSLISVVRVHSLPTAITQVIIRDYFENYGLVETEGYQMNYTPLGLALLETERTQEIPCPLDLLK